MASSSKSAVTHNKLQPVNPEVSEFMIRKLDGQILPGLNATPESGLRYNGCTGQWVPELTGEDEINFEQIYSHCVRAQNTLIETANKLARKRKLPTLHAKGIHSWTEVEESVTTTCNILEDIAEKDGDSSAGFTGKLKGAFRRLCQNAGTGTTLVNLVPTDNYLSVLCGGLKIIFMALQQTDHYRKDIYNALEDIPFIIGDHVAMVEINRSDEGLHRRAAALYASLFNLMEVMFAWYLKSSLAMGTRLFLNPSKFSEELKSRLADVKLSAQRFSTYTNLIATRRQQNLEQQTYSMIYLQGKSISIQSQNAQAILNGIDNLNTSQAALLEQIAAFLGANMRRDLADQRGNNPSGPAPTAEAGDLLWRYQYDPKLVPTDCNNLLHFPFSHTSHIDEDRIHTIKSNIRFQNWILVNESALLLLNANSPSSSNLDMSFVSAQAFQHALQVPAAAAEQTNARSQLIPLAFFCSQHRDYRRDVNATPSELGMSLILQLVKAYRGFDPGDLAAVFEELRPDENGKINDLELILQIFGQLVSRLPAGVVVLLIVDGLKYFADPRPRRTRMADLVAGLVAVYRMEHAATLKFLFANSTRTTDYLEGMFTNDEILRLPRDSSSGEGYNTGSWAKGINLGNGGMQPGRG